VAGAGVKLGSGVSEAGGKITAAADGRVASLTDDWQPAAEMSIVVVIRSVVKSFIFTPTIVQPV
jgi:hypothetical protein